jgi:hypothetical protein
LITEADKESQTIKRLEDAIALCEQTISKAEKYERLNENKDWQDFWKDVEFIAQTHDKEIKLAEESLVDAPENTYLKGDGIVVSSRLDWANYIARHYIQRQELLRWMNEPKWILDMAAQARAKLPELKNKLELLKKESNHAA